MNPEPDDDARAYVKSIGDGTNTDLLERLAWLLSGGRMIYNDQRSSFQSFLASLKDESDG